MTTRWEVERAVCASDLSPQERLTALTLLTMATAENAVIPAEHTPSLTRIQSMTGQGATTVKRALNGLEAAGWVVRKRPDVAKARADKERTRYALKVPVTRPREDLEARSKEGLARSTQGLVTRSKEGLGLGPQRATSQTAYQTYNNQQQISTSPEALVREATGATADEATAIVKRIAAERNPKNLAGFVRHLAGAGDLAQYLTDQRAAAARYADDADRKIRQSMARCQHGVAGGDQAHTVTGQIRCGTCRNRGRAERLNGTAQVINLHTKEVS